MDVYQKLPTALRLKILNYFQNPICDALLQHWQSKYYYYRRNVLVDLNRYNYFQCHRKKAWDKLRDTDDNTLIYFQFRFPYRKDTLGDYLFCLQQGWWCPRNETKHSTKLRTALYNTLEEQYWLYHGQCGNPETLHHTLFDPKESIREVASDFEVPVPLDPGTPSFHYDEWARRCGEGGSVPLSQRRKVRAPRDARGKWDSNVCSNLIKQRQIQRQRKRVRRVWSRWEADDDEANTQYAYYELINRLD